MKDGHDILFCGYQITAHTKVLTQDPCPFGLPEILPGAHIAVSINWGSVLWVSL